jgi:competence protein ComEC
MSFAAVVALVAAYEALRGPEPDQRAPGILRPAMFFLGGIVLSTLIASVAVAPFAAYHFHRSQQYALLANLLAIPLCNVVVMPAALLTMVAMPLGLEAYPLAVMAWGIEAMTWAATFVAGLPGAVMPLRAMPEFAFALMAGGGIWLTLWQRQWRWAGVIAIAAGIVAAPQRDRPDVMFGAVRGGLVAVRGDDGRLAVLADRPKSFDLTRWLEHDGDARTGAEATKARAFRCDGTGCTARIKGLTVAVVRHASAFRDDCGKTDILLATLPAPADCTKPRTIIDTRALRRDGAHALYVQDDGTIRIETVAAARGDRPWASR